MLYRVALQGFADDERRSLASLLRESDHREPGYLLVHQFADADVIMADGDSPQVVADVIDEARLATTLFIGGQQAPAAALHVARPTHPAQVLRGLDQLVARLDSDLASRPAELGSEAHARARAAARRAARRARLAAVAAPAPSLAPPDVLVLDANDVEREMLCALLEQFGFCAYPARNPTQALWLIETRPFRAAFLDIALDEGVGIELCQRITAGSHAMRAAALYIVSSHVNPTERVRAALAGSHAFLVKPLRRGDVAQAIEASGLALPADARRI